MNKQQLKDKIFKTQDILIELEKQLKEIETKESTPKDYQEVKYKGKIFRIYIWEDKLYKDFTMPQDFDFADFNDVIELYDNDKIKLEVYKYYICKHFSKKQQKKEFGLSGLYLDCGLDLNSYDGNLADSVENGRVIISKKVGR